MGRSSIRGLRHVVELQEVGKIGSSLDRSLKLYVWVSDPAREAGIVS